MHVLASLENHDAEGPREEADRLRMIAFARSHPNPFDRGIPEGHFTGSGLVMSEDGAEVLLLHHAKLHRWLQPGGHGEPGETVGEEVAAREVTEETGLEPRLHPKAPRPLDIDIHAIPARPSEPAHEHLDLRYLFLANPRQALRIEPTGPAVRTGGELPLRWFRVDDALAMDIDAGLKRMIRKAAVILAR